MLSEREAWLKLKEHFADDNLRTTRNPDGKEVAWLTFEHGTRDFWNTCLGLCSIIHCLQLTGQLDGKIANKMLETITRLPPWTPRNGYKWPCTREGAKQRRKFCQLQANLLAPDEEVSGSATTSRRDRPRML